MVNGGSINKNAEKLVETVCRYGGKSVPSSPFIKWHLEKKFQIILSLYERYLPEGSHLLDVGCSDGDCLVLAQMCNKNAELWGIDIDRSSLEVAKHRCKGSKTVFGDILNIDHWPDEYFDIIHEFGASFLLKDWGLLVRQYFRYLKVNGILLWELPQKWSSAHLSYLFSIAPKLNEKDTILSRAIRSFMPSKYSFYSDKQVQNFLKNSGYAYEIIETVPLWHFYCKGMLQSLVNAGYIIWGNNLFNELDKINHTILPRMSGQYLVIRKKEKL